ncbi:DUF2332 domain-containing protein [Jatrophihabitans lederbergiae]|uniref:DUF2332 domain-containing protein n=1 Tax=Jatrophihabitans lederbergiae TaxID=3075547 RepID=A0ABU2J635_9ACTN|nr:DUF2332 domain-containing protein [Jatrophihabitans sp. DSM 44399]MDT0260452.1 DUF2332 domain-containing protein [Jatrophihabitans sp. DSM 44399]
MSTPTLAVQFRDHAQQMRGLYRFLLTHLADDWESGGVVREICRDWEAAPAESLVQLRLLARLQRLVLTRRARELGSYYPNLGGSADYRNSWPAFRTVLAEHVQELRDALQVVPQTNEVGRATALLVGIFDAVRRSGLDRIRLLEPGASAGLNLLVDHFRIGRDTPTGWASGPADSPLRLERAVIGAVQPVDYTIVSRRGCDLAPVDPTTEEGRLTLTSFVWPDDLERHERLKAALQVAAHHPVTVDRSTASEWLDARLSEDAGHRVLTVVWNSVTAQYWPPDEQDRVHDILSAAAGRVPLAQVSMEHVSSEEHQGAQLTVAVSVGSGDPGTFEPVRVATVADHGVPVNVLP